jgi:hypothetical protein
MKTIAVVNYEPALAASGRVRCRRRSSWIPPFLPVPCARILKEIAPATIGIIFELEDCALEPVHAREISAKAERPLRLAGVGHSRNDDELGRHNLEVRVELLPAGAEPRCARPRRNLRERNELVWDDWLCIIEQLAKTV